MAFRRLVQQRATLPILGSAFALSTLLYPNSTLHAEAPPDPSPPRKSIYDDFQNRKQTHSPPPPTTFPSNTPSPTPTDRLAAQIRHARLFIYAHTAAAEDRLNDLMSSALRQEQSFTQTLASLAPPLESHERLVPGSLYVLVAAMTGSIMTRNRNIFLRATVPAAIGLGTAWVVLPITMRNVGDLVWTFEEKVPVVALNHMRVRGAVEEGARQFRIHADATRRWSDEKAREGREAIEAWVRKGR